MIYVGVDIGKAEHCLGAIDAQGKVVLKPTRFTQDAAGFAKLARLLNDLGSPESVKVGMEATGHYWVLLADELSVLGYNPDVFNPILSCDAARSSVRGRKTDEDDCLVIAKVVRDGGYSRVMLPEASMGELKRLTRYRQHVVEQCANAKKRLISILDLVFPEFVQVMKEPFGPTALALLAKAPSARLMASHKAKSLSGMVRKKSHGRLGLERVEELIVKAKASIAVRRCDTASELAIRHLVAEIELLEEQIAAFEQQIEAIPVPGRDLLQSIPGVGPVLSSVIMAEIVTIDRFIPKPGDEGTSGGINRLLAFAGLDPRVRSSGQWTGKVKMTKRGSRILRTAVWRAAYLARNSEGFSDIYRHHKGTMGQHQKLALSHVARKIVQAIYGVLKTQKPFNLDAFRGKTRTAA